MDVVGGNMLMTRYSDIRGGPERIDYEFEGGPYLRISYPMMDEIYSRNRFSYEAGAQISIGPYKFRIVEIRPWRNECLAIQDKWPLWWLAVVWHRINKLPDLFYKRLIATLAVWRLADYHDAAVPCIGDIHLVQKVRKWLTHT